jgi:molecular chaperone GrpE (heat shock protein)
MRNWLKTIIGGEERKGAPTQAIDSARDLQTLRLELAQREQETAQLQGELTRLRERSAVLAETTIEAQLEQLLADLSRPIGLLLALTTERDRSAEEKDAALEGVVELLRQVIHVLQDHGWQPVGQVGEIVDYDPALHQPLGQDESPAPGDAVAVRWPGGAFGGRVLLRAGVTLQKESGGGSHARPSGD